MQTFKRISSLLAIAVIVALVALPQAARGPLFESTPANVSIYENVPVYVPSSTTDVITGDIWLEEITLANTTSGSLTACVDDKQASPRAIVPCVSIAAHQVYVIDFKARWAPGGVSWSASAGSSIVGTVRGKRLGP
jgi:hypothetical protein